MSLKIRLNLMITALLVLIMGIGTLLMLVNAREDVRAEVDSTAKLAVYLLDAETLYFTQAGEVHTQSFRLQNLNNLRHLRIDFYDPAGNLIDSNNTDQRANQVDAPPRWFIHAMGMHANQWLQTRRLIQVDGHPLGVLVVTPDPSYEIAEVWHDTRDLLMLSALFFLLVNTMVYWAVGHALKPVDGILAALSELERGNLQARLPMFRLPELQRISEKFNLMAGNLETSVQRNHLLSQQLIRAQEDERKHLARELHDEIGQSLTAISADATAIMNADIAQPRVKESAAAIMQVARHVVSIVRDMLEHLRPDTLDQLGLHIALHDLIDNWKARHRQVTVEARLTESLDGLGEFVPITLYRLMQEALTNISKHAQANRVDIELQRQDGYLHLVIRDNGRGFDPGAVSEGFGLAGMRERVEGLGGRLAVASGLEAMPGKTGGTVVNADIPIPNPQEFSGE